MTTTLDFVPYPYEFESAEIAKVLRNAAFRVQRGRDIITALSGAANRFNSFLYEPAYNALRMGLHDVGESLTEWASHVGLRTQYVVMHRVADRLEAGGI